MSQSKKSWSVAAAAALIALCGVNLNPQPSHAIVGMITANVVMIGGGVVLGGTGMFIAGAAGEGPSMPGDEVVSGVGWTLVALGFTLLDDHGAQRLQFGPLSTDVAATIGVSETERLAFNSSLDEINAVAEAIDADLSAQKAPSVEFAASRWKAYSPQLDSDAARAVVKVATQLVQAERKS